MSNTIQNTQLGFDTLLTEADCCWRRVKTDHLCRSKIDQAFSDVAYYVAVDKSTRLRWF